MGNNFDRLNGSPVVYKRQKWLNVRQFKDELGFLETSVVALHSAAYRFPRLFIPSIQKTIAKLFVSK